MDFVRDLNGLRGDSQAPRLATASEACFTMDEHLGCVDRRVARLAKLDPRDDLDHQAARFAVEDLQPLWGKIRSSLIDRSGRAGLKMDTALPESRRCLSPSDFGFHNALVAEDGFLRFVDFEYAGWDDPAKLICDFFCQPEIPVPDSLRAMAVERLTACLPLDAEGVFRAWLLWPAYRIKWCCIMLNEFVRADRMRRVFSGGEATWTERRGRQLAKARRAFQEVMKMWHCHFSSNTPSW
jgi:hypothetical protein